MLPAVVLCGAYAALQHVSAELQVDTRLDFLRRRSTRLDYDSRKCIRGPLRADDGQFYAQILAKVNAKFSQPRTRPRRTWRCGGRADHPGAPRGSKRSA